MIHQINTSKPNSHLLLSYQFKFQKAKAKAKTQQQPLIQIIIMSSSSSSYGVTFPLILLFLLTLLVSIIYSDATTTIIPQANGSLTSKEMLSLMEPKKVVEMRLMMNESKRKLGGFQICALCTCCGGAKGLCLPSPCCYAINCNIPNRPFGFCSFTPKTCNCFGCHI